MSLIHSTAHKSSKHFPHQPVVDLCVYGWCRRWQQAAVAAAATTRAAAVVAVASFFDSKSIAHTKTKNKSSPCTFAPCMRAHTQATQTRKHLCTWSCACVYALSCMGKEQRGDFMITRAVRGRGVEEALEDRRGKDEQKGEALV